jgi:hypothetical protein
MHAGTDASADTTAAELHMHGHPVRGGRDRAGGRLQQGSKLYMQADTDAFADTTAAELHMHGHQVRGGRDRVGGRLQRG